MFALRSQGIEDDGAFSATAKGLRRSRMHIEMNCAECGENSFNLGNGVKGYTIIRCGACGHEIGTLDELKERVATEVLKRAKAHPTPD